MISIETMRRSSGAGDRKQRVARTKSDERGALRQRMEQRGQGAEFGVNAAVRQVALPKSVHKHGV
jgi:hypothetical protein